MFVFRHRLRLRNQTTVNMTPAVLRRLSSTDIFVEATRHRARGTRTRHQFLSRTRDEKYYPPSAQKQSVSKTCYTVIVLRMIVAATALSQGCRATSYCTTNDKAKPTKRKLSAPTSMTVLARRRGFPSFPPSAGGRVRLLHSGKPLFPDKPYLCPPTPEDECVCVSKGKGRRRRRHHCGITGSLLCTLYDTIILSSAIRGLVSLGRLLDRTFSRRLVFGGRKKNEETENGKIVRRVLFFVVHKTLTKKIDLIQN